LLLIGTKSASPRRVYQPVSKERRARLESHSHSICPSVDLQQKPHADTAKTVLCVYVYVAPIFGVKMKCASANILSTSSLNTEFHLENGVSLEHDGSCRCNTENEPSTARNVHDAFRLGLYYNKTKTCPELSWTSRRTPRHCSTVQARHGRPLVECCYILYTEQNNPHQKIVRERERASCMGLDTPHLHEHKELKRDP
jgi:hypothetical protein